MFVSGDTLYFVQDRRREPLPVGFEDGAVTGAPTRINGPRTGGVDWTNKSMFFLAGSAGEQATDRSLRDLMHRRRLCRRRHGLGGP